MEPVSLETRLEVDGSTVVVHAKGDVDVFTSDLLQASLAQAVQQSHEVVVDLAGVKFIDSSGLGALVSGLKTARQAGGDLRLARAGEQVRTVLSLTNLDRVLRSHDTVGDATDGW